MTETMIKVKDAFPQEDGLYKCLMPVDNPKRNPYRDLYFDSLHNVFYDYYYGDIGDPRVNSGKETLICIVYDVIAWDQNKLEA